MSRHRSAFAFAFLFCAGASAVPAAGAPLRVGVFQAEVTPLVGSPLCNGAVKPVKQITTPLTARGVVLLGAGRPVVLCAFDWVGIANESHEVCRAELAAAVDTTPDRVAVHTLHQHDAPGSDFATERLLAANGLGGLYSNAEFDREAIRRVAIAAKAAVASARPVTHLGFGAGVVERVASNRRIFDPATGQVKLQRQSAGGRNPAAREAPEGTIDRLARLVAFWDGERPVAALTYYATHPMSHYGQGAVNWDTVGYAREQRERALPGVAHLHFNGAGGNVAAGKYNDGAPERRPELAGRLADGMRRAWETQEKFAIDNAGAGWAVRPVVLPVRDTLVEAQLAARIKDTKLKQPDRLWAARDLVFLRRMHSGQAIPISCLQLGPARVLHLPGELFVEYQLAAQAMRPGKFTAMAAYGDYGPGYIGTAVAYGQGGYETGIVSRVAPAVEEVLTRTMRELLAQAP